MIKRKHFLWPYHLVYYVIKLFSWTIYNINISKDKSKTTSYIFLLKPSIASLKIVQFFLNCLLRKYTKPDCFWFFFSFSRPKTKVNITKNFTFYYFFIVSKCSRNSGNLGIHSVSYFYLKETVLLFGKLLGIHTFSDNIKRNIKGRNSPCCNSK